MPKEKPGSRRDHSIAASDARKQGGPAGTWAEAEGSPIDLHGAMVAPKPVPELSPIARPEGTELERRVLAHERILQALIAHMAETEPKFLRRLADIFCLPMQMVHCEHDYTDTDAYAAEFIRTVVRLGDKPAGRSPDTVRSRKSPGVAPSGDTGKEPNFIAPPRIRMRHAGGVWRVTKDGRFHGDFSKKEDALAAVEAAGSGTAQSP